MGVIAAHAIVGARHALVANIGTALTIDADENPIISGSHGLNAIARLRV